MINPDLITPRLLDLHPATIHRDDDEDEGVPARRGVAPSRTVPFLEARRDEIEKHARISCMSSSASHIPPDAPAIRELIPIELADGTATTMRPPIPEVAARLFRAVTVSEWGFIYGLILSPRLPRNSGKRSVDP